EHHPKADADHGAPEPRCLAGGLRHLVDAAPIADLSCVEDGDRCEKQDKAREPERPCEPSDIVEIEQKNGDAKHGRRHAACERADGTARRKRHHRFALHQRLAATKAPITWANVRAMKPPTKASSGAFSVFP